MNETQQYKCMKCGNDNYEEFSVSTTGGLLTKILNMQSNKFKAIACTKCGYTELFKGAKAGIGESILDIFTN
tara:strand:- start:2685 stop:2900 length:216 start_codon:yes stop_codon:yes gene_type:complete